MAEDLAIKKGDTRPWNMVLKENGSAVDLTAATSVKLYLRRVGAATNKVDGTALTVVTPASGAVRFSPSASDVDTSGTFQAYYKVTWNDDTESRFPTRDGLDDFDTILITPNFE